jgi:hypothetical protein
MDVSCENKILQDVRELIKDVILPRLDKIEEEVRELRKVTWPVCQSLREKSQLTDIQNKKKFLEILDDDEVIMLLNEKASVSSRSLSFSSSQFCFDESCLIKAGT